MSVYELLVETQAGSLRIFSMLLHHLEQVIKERPDLDFNWWLPLAENRLEQRILIGGDE